MPLGYMLKTGEILAYYGESNIAETLFEYGKDRKVIITSDPGTLAGGGGQQGFRSPDEIPELVKKSLDGNKVPRKYPAFHSTVGRYGQRNQNGADIVIDIDVKNNYREAFMNGRKVIQFLDYYNVPYRVKFSGGSGPHIIIPYEAFPQSMQNRFSKTYQLVFQVIISKSKASHIDGSFAATSHFCRMPYSLNEITGLVSVPIMREQYNDFTPSMAEAWNVKVDKSWFQKPDESEKEAISEMIRDSKGF